MFREWLTILEVLVRWRSATGVYNVTAEVVLPYLYASGRLVILATLMFMERFIKCRSKYVTRLMKYGLQISRTAYIDFLKREKKE